MLVFANLIASPGGSCCLPYKMIRFIFTTLIVFSPILSMSQNTTFTQRVNRLFFGVDVSQKSASLVDSFLSVRQLHYHDDVVLQWNLNTSIEMKSGDAWSSRHEFTFTESPLPDLKIENGAIEIMLGETDSTKKLLNLYWRLRFSTKAAATKYFNQLKQQFDDIATKKKFETDKDGGSIAQFSIGNQADSQVRHITFFLGKSLKTKKYEISLVFGSEPIK